jgi:hypothetical protein
MDKRAPVQGWAAGIPWDLHMEAYSAYCKRYGPQKALIEGGCRGGFHTNELDVFLPGWREKVSALVVAAARILELETENAALRHDLERCTARELVLLNPPQSDAATEGK